MNFLIAAFILLGFGVTLVAVGKLRQAVDTVTTLLVNHDIESRINHVAGRQYVGGLLEKRVIPAIDELQGNDLEDVGTF